MGNLMDELTRLDVVVLEEEFVPANEPDYPLLDLGHYPEDVRPALQAIRRWGLRAPGKSAKRGLAKWILFGRELMDACGEFDPEDVAAEEFAAWNLALQQGQAYTVAGPQSLVNTFRARAALMRTQPAGQLGAGEIVRQIVHLIQEGAGHPIARQKIDWSEVPERVRTVVHNAGGWGYLSSLPHGLIERKVREAL